MALSILSLNAGSSSLKFAVFHMASGSERALASGEASGVGQGGGRIALKTENRGVVVDRPGEFPSHAQAMKAMLVLLGENGLDRFDGAGHRMVHGGRDLFEPQKVDKSLVERLREVVAFAPLHLPSQIAIIESLAQHSPRLAQVTCFDTAFHRSIPEAARRFALPRFLFDEGILRYGFHGLSYEFVVNALGTKLGRRAVIAHLGSGASMVALKDGKPIDTSMGLTPSGGFMMGTRSGDLDPGILLYLLERGWTGERITDTIEHHSGLAGVSGVSSDMRILLERRRSDARAAEAVDMFCYQAQKFVGAFAAALGGLDSLVFTGGIGEHAAEVRKEICAGLNFLGINLEEALNSAHARVISTADSDCTVRVIATNEELMVARHTYRVLATG
jgi:acetate kinase